MECFKDKNWMCVLGFFQQLSESLDAFGYKWEINPGDGAFYGPKVRQKERNMVKLHFIEFYMYENVDCFDHAFTLTD